MMILVSHLGYVQELIFEHIMFPSKMCLPPIDCNALGLDQVPLETLREFRDRTLSGRHFDPDPHSVHFSKLRDINDILTKLSHSEQESQCEPEVALSDDQTDAVSEQQV